MSDEISVSDVSANQALTKGKRAVKPAEKVFVDALTSNEDIVKWDSDGKQVFFADDFKELPSEVIDKLSRLTVVKYEQALEIRARLAAVDPEFDKINKSLQISQSSYASPSDIAFHNKAKAGLRAKLVREDRLGHWESKGYVMAKPEHMVDAKMRKVEGHFEHGVAGQPKEYLMVTTIENQNRLKREREAERARIDERQQVEVAAANKAAGVDL